MSLGGGSDLMIRYHDEEWGVPVHDDWLLFEFLILEGAQAGLSWETVLRKRERYRQVFDGFDARPELPVTTRAKCAPCSPTLESFETV